MTVSKKVLEVLKALVASYVVTGIILSILALLVFKYELGEKVVNIAIIVTYVAATLFGGFVVGKRIRAQKFVWGLLLGLLYMLVILLASALLNQSFAIISSNNLTTFLLCAAGGMLGGMLS